MFKAFWIALLSLGALFSSSTALEKEAQTELLIAQRLIDQKEYDLALTSTQKVKALDAKFSLDADYLQVIAHYQKQQFHQAIRVFEGGALRYAPTSFEHYQTLLEMLFECYEKTHNPEQGSLILNKLATAHQDVFSLLTAQALYRQDINQLAHIAKTHSSQLLQKWAQSYQKKLKSPKKAKWLSLLVPGLGYYYVGQKQSAVTSFLINSLLIAATAQCVITGLYPLAIALGTFECGWYFGGAKGASRSTEDYNHQLFSELEEHVKNQKEQLNQVSETILR